MSLKRLLLNKAVLEVEGIRIGQVQVACHGPDLVGAEMMAWEMEVQVLVSGHIHRPLIEKGEKPHQSVRTLSHHTGG